MSSSIREDFDAIAKATPGQRRWNHNNHYHARMLGLLPRERGAALDLGCGTGDFAELLSRQFGEVTAVDFSHEMILRAGERMNGWRPAERSLFWTWPDGLRPQSCFPELESIISCTGVTC